MKPLRLTIAALAALAILAAGRPVTATGGQPPPQVPFRAGVELVSLNVTVTDGTARYITDLTPEDFDGHTEFYRLTPEQRLEWLCQAATFVYEFKGKANSEVGN